MDVIRRIFGRSFARARASNRAKDWPVPAQGVRFPRHSAPQRRRKPSGGRGGKCRNRAQEHHAPAQGPWVAGSRRGSAHARRRGAGESICTLWTPRRTRLRRRGAPHFRRARQRPLDRVRRVRPRYPGHGRTAGGSLRSARGTCAGGRDRRGHLLRTSSNGSGKRRAAPWDTLAPDPSGRRRRLDGRSERAAQARSRGPAEVARF